MSYDVSANPGQPKFLSDLGNVFSSLGEGIGSALDSYSQWSAQNVDGGGSTGTSQPMTPEEVAELEGLGEGTWVRDANGVLVRTDAPGFDFAEYQPPPPAETSSWGILDGVGGFFSDIGASLGSMWDSFRNYSTTNATTTPGITPTGSTGGGGTSAIPASYTGGQTQPPATNGAPPAAAAAPGFFSVEKGQNWLANKLVLGGKFKIPYWFIIVLVAVVYWKRKQIMGLFRKKR